MVKFKLMLSGIKHQKMLDKICFPIDAVCWFSSDHLTVLLGNIKSVKDNKFTIQFSSSNNIRTYRSWPKLSSSMLSNEIIIPIVPSEVINTIQI